MNTRTKMTADIELINEQVAKQQKQFVEQQKQFVENQAKINKQHNEQAGLINCIIRMTGATHIPMLKYDKESDKNVPK